MIQPAGSIPDINGDGLSEIVIRGNLVRPDGPERGGGYVIYGQRRFAQGDFDQDRDVDLHDFADFILCFNGPNRQPAQTCPQSINADFDGDHDVDLSDFSTFALNFTGTQ